MSPDDDDDTTTTATATPTTTTGTAATATMTALGITQFGLSNLSFHENLPLPQLNSSTQLLIEVIYSDINPVDVQKLTQQPKDTPVPSTRQPLLVVGFGGSGIVISIGCDVPNSVTNPTTSRSRSRSSSSSPTTDDDDLHNDEPYTVGSTVVFLCDPTMNGSYATHVCVDYRMVYVIPQRLLSSISMADLACIPVAGNTAYEALEKVGLTLKTLYDDNDNNNNVPSVQTSSSSTTITTPPTKTLLIVGGAGGVGSWATLLARYRYPTLHIVITTSTPNDENTKRWCLQRLGANQMIAHDDIIKDLPNAGRKGSVDYVLCATEPTKSVWKSISEIIKPFGHVCIIGSGQSLQRMDLSFLFFKSITIHTETVFNKCRTGFRCDHHNTMINNNDDNNSSCCNNNNNNNNVHQSQQMKHIVQLLWKKQIPYTPLIYHWDTTKTTTAATATTATTTTTMIPAMMDWKQAIQQQQQQTDNIFDKISSGHCRGKMVMKITK